MADSPNTSPAFMQTMGLLGIPVELTNQVCTRDNPGFIPVTAYDSTADYAQGNGALVETIDIQITGNTAATVVVMFDRFLNETQPKWRKVAEVAIPLISPSATTAIASYKVPLKDLLFPIAASNASASPLPQLQGYRINSSNIQIGFALTVATGGTSPIIVRLYGGEY